SNNGGFSNTIHYSTIRSELFDVSNWQTAHIINCQFQGDSCAGGKSAIPEHTSTKVVDYLIDKRIMSRSLR
ncbi:MAG: hypothetical protein GY754_45075, partial [bacterium]|nr:hypothetical protein [bacterium]